MFRRKPYKPVMCRFSTGKKGESAVLQDRRYALLTLSQSFESTRRMNWEVQRYLHRLPPSSGALVRGGQVDLAGPRPVLPYSSLGRGQDVIKRHRGRAGPDTCAPTSHLSLPGGPLPDYLPLNGRHQWPASRHPGDDGHLSSGGKI